MTASLAEYWERIDHSMSDRLANGALLDEIADEILNDSSMVTCADALYAAAYCKYVHPERVSSEGRQAEFMSVAQKVFQLQPDHTYMWLFVGFNHFDAGKFAAARDAFDKTNDDDLATDDKIKKAELKLCCVLYDLDVPAALLLIGQFVEQCLRESEFDVLPVHFLEWVEYACRRTVPSPDARLRLRQLVRRLVIGLHQEEVFKDVLGLLDEWARN